MLSSQSSWEYNRTPRSVNTLTSHPGGTRQDGVGEVSPAVDKGPL